MPGKLYDSATPSHRLTASAAATCPELPTPYAADRKEKGTTNILYIREYGQECTTGVE